MSPPAAEEHEVHEAVGVDDRQQRQTLRQSLRAERAALSRPLVDEASRAVCAALSSLPPLARAQTVALYSAVDGEIDLSPLRAELHDRSVAVVFPRVVSHRPPEMIFHVVGKNDVLAPTGFSIPAPDDSAPLAGDVDVFIIPAVALSRDGRRLGFGFGHYDAALRRHPRALRIGVVHDFQLVAPFPTHAGDEPVDLIQTPRERIVTRARAFAPEEVLS
jgi:5-formyltetrahydrofolate cyclo-ligase